MKLYVPLPSCFKFKRIFDENEYLQEAEIEQLKSEEEDTAAGVEEWLN
jgi:hypothetical protein